MHICCKTETPKIYKKGEGVYISSTRNQEDILVNKDYRVLVGVLVIRSVFKTDRITKTLGKTYQFCTTPFGLSLVPWLFTKLTEPILEWARSQQIRLSAYLDDWIIIADSKMQATQHTQLTLQKLESLGWIINYKKSILKPQQSLEHLSFLLDTTTMTA